MKTMRENTNENRRTEDGRHDRQNGTLHNADIVVFAILLLAFNTHLWGLELFEPQIFHPARVSGGEWWRIATHPLVHVSWYHLLLDGVAFLLLYSGLEYGSALKRLLCAAVCCVSGLISALLLSSRISDIGLCGLSGTAHGLMVLSALQAARKPDGFAIGVLCLLLVAGKSVYETISGNVVFEFMHMGMCGTAIASCHLGGVAGGAVAFLLFGSGKKSLRVAPPALESFR